MWSIRLVAVLLLISLSFAASAQAQGFGDYTVIPSIPGNCCGLNFSGNASSTDTVTLSRTEFVPLVGTSTVTANLPLSAFASAADIQNVNARIDQAFQQMQQINNNITQVERGVAASVAMANTFMPSAPGRTSWAVNGSTFDGQMGFGFSIAHRLNLNVPIAITAGYANGAGTAQIGRVGLMGEF